MLQVFVFNSKIQQDFDILIFNFFCFTQDLRSSNDLFDRGYELYYDLLCQVIKI